MKREGDREKKNKKKLQNPFRVVGQRHLNVHIKKCFRSDFAYHQCSKKEKLDVFLEQLCTVKAGHRFPGRGTVLINNL